MSLQGEVAFDGAEFAVRNLMQSAPQTDSYILDMHRVSYLSDSAARLLHDARRALMAQDKALIFSRIRGRAVIEGALRHTLAEGDKGFLSFEDNDVAVEWCEDRLLEATSDSPQRAGTLAAFALFAGMAESTLVQLERCMRTETYAPGEVIIAAGDPHDDRVFLIDEGEVSVVLELADGSHQRIATLSGGMSFGEMVMLGQAARSASVYADTAVRCWTLSAGALDALAIDHPEIKIAALTNLSLDLAQKLRQANKMIGALAS